MASELAVDEQPGTSATKRLANPHQIYSRRLNQRKDTAQALDAQMDKLGLARLATFAGGLVIVWLAAVSELLSLWWLAAPVLLFYLLLLRYDRIWRQWRRAKRAIRYYERGIDRLEDRWHGKGITGQRYLDENHLYALDLDVFGKGSLFERLCTARTRPGEETLAGWLRRPDTPEEIAARQEAVRELCPRLDLREDVALLGSEVPPVEYSDLIHWGTAPLMLTSFPLRLLVFVLALINVATAVAWLVFGWNALFFATALVAAGSVAIWLGRRVQEVLDPVESMGRELFLLAGILGRIERESFTTPRLRELHEAVLVEGEPASVQIGKLAGLIEWLNSMKNQFFLPLALLLLWRTQMAFALEGWRRQSGPFIRQWLRAIGSLEALNSLAGYAFENPDHSFPEVVADCGCVEGANLGHPLLPSARCVCNDVRLNESTRVLIVSGSNMSGKSTMLRTVGTNAVLAFAGAPVRAKTLRLAPMSIVATLRIQDSLLEGRSRFFAEISRVRELLEEIEKPLPVLFLLDELFHGTNSHDRGIGAEALLQRLLKGNALGMITTHDLSLTQIADRLGDHVHNVHFADQFVDGQMHFDYKIRSGVVPHSNALALMRAVGLEV